MPLLHLLHRSEPAAYNSVREASSLWQAYKSSDFGWHSKKVRPAQRSAKAGMN